MNADKIIDSYYDEFGEMPPAVKTIDYYDDLYLKLMQKAVSKKEKITSQILDKVLETKKYDLVVDNEEVDFAEKLYQQDEDYKKSF